MPPKPRLKTVDFRAARKFLSAATPLSDFIATADALNPQQRALIVDQAIILLENCYAHLPLKCAMYAVDPLRRLRLLRHRLAQFGSKSSIQADLSFHAEMADIFSSFRDMHTRYFLPVPFQSATAFLPFDVETFYERGRRKYLATHFARWYKPSTQTFEPDVEILYWNGVPIARAVEIAGQQSAASNPAARRANGLIRLTKRSLATAPLPDEEWVIVGYKTAKSEDEVRVNWRVLPALPPETDTTPIARRTKPMHISLAHEIDHVRQLRKLISAPHIVAKCARLAAARSRRVAVNAKTDTHMPDCLRVDVRKGRNGLQYGYIRIFKFPADHPDAFVLEFERLLRHVPQGGLIIDIRENPGGKIVAAEQLLQLLTSRRPIQPERLYFINTPLTLRLCQVQARDYDLACWIPSIKRSMETGATFSASFPISSRVDYCNEREQVFRGPVTLVTNALSYSAAEFFAAGFQDHCIGAILGTDSATGAAGAHVKDYGSLRELFKRKPPFGEQLPKETEMTIALRRSVRVGEHNGAEVEDFGVTPDVLYLMTRKDLLDANTGLIDYAASLLGAMVVRVERTSDGVRLYITTNEIAWSDGVVKRINEIDILINWRLRHSIKISAKRSSISLGPVDNEQPIEVQGYLRCPTGRHLVTVQRI